MNVSTDVDRPFLPPVETGLTGQVTIDPGRQRGSNDRQIAIVIDTSGSMSGQKIDRAIDGAKYALGYLDDSDYLTLIDFNSSVSVVCNADRYGNMTRDSVANQIDNLTAGGGTDIYGALEKAQEQLEALPSGPDVAKRILLLTDGKDNRRGPEDFDRQAREIDERGIRIRAGGIGSDYNMETIQTLGTVARGEWAHIEQASEIQQFLGEGLEEAGTVIGTNAELQMDLANGVELTEVYRAEKQVQQSEVDYQGDNVAVIKLPDLKDQQQQEVSMKMKAPGREAGQEMRLAKVTATARGETATGEITVEYTDDSDKVGVRREPVSQGLDEKRTRVLAGKGDVEEAQTQVENMKKKYGEGAVEDVEDTVTRVAEGGRADQEGATKVDNDNKKV
jgi:Ca-activated chloride channel family protein